MVDATRRKLRIPLSYVPYMEKHHIYELLYDLVTQLVIKKPQDHILFLQQELYHTRGGRRLILLAPPHFDRAELAYQIAANTGATPLSFVKEDGRLPEDVVGRLSDNNVRKTGWILYDYPNNKESAVALQRTGVLPSHVIQVLVPMMDEESYVNPCDPPVNKVAATHEYYKHLPGLQQAYHTTLTECDARDRSMQQVANVCTAMLSRMPHRGAPLLHRVVILGSRGSGRRTQALLLSKRFRLIHVDIAVLVAHARSVDSCMGNKIRSLNQYCIPVYPEILASLVKTRVMEQDCLDHGWVLTGYPKNVREFVLLNGIQTPPNRIIFLNVNPDIACERVTGRRINTFTGEHYHIETNPPVGKERCLVAMHPLDSVNIVKAQVAEFQKELPALQEFCGMTATHINGNLSVRVVSDMVQAVVLHPAPTVFPHSSGVRGVEWWHSVMYLCQDRLLPLLERLGQLANLCKEEAIVMVEHVVEELLQSTGKVSEATKIVEQILEDMLPGENVSEAIQVVYQILGGILPGEEVPEETLIVQQTIEEIVSSEEVPEETHVVHQIIEEIVSGEEVPEETHVVHQIIEEIVSGEEVPEETHVVHQIIEEIVSGEEVPEATHVAQQIIEEIVSGEEVPDETHVAQQIIEEIVSGEEVPEATHVAQQIIEEIVSGEEVPEETRVAL